MTDNFNINSQKDIDDAVKAMGDPQVRRALMKKSLLLFTCAYFNHYITFALSKFHKELIGLLENLSIRHLGVMAFRNSGKSTFMTTIYPIWAIMGDHQKKHVLIISKTDRQAKLHLQSIRTELEHNALLKQDLGPFKEDGSWGIEGLVLEKYGARIACYSIEQSVRGIRHGAHRPDLIILDDFEDGESVKTIEARDKTYTWVNNEVLQSGSRQTRVLYAGNYLHDDCYLMRLKAILESNPSQGKFMWVPLVYPDGSCSWSECFKTREEIEEFRQQMDDRTWQTEYLLRSVPEKDQIIKEADIHYYDGCPYLNNPRTQLFALGVDPAYALGPKNDYTGMVAGALVGYGKDAKLYILPGVVIKRMPTDGLIGEIRRIVKGFPEFKRSKVYIEGSHGERGWATMLKTEKIEAEAVAAKDGKRNRLELYSHLISRGTILFPKTGAEELIKQLVYFKGAEHEDAADAYSLMVQCMAEKYFGRGEGGVTAANLNNCLIIGPRPDGVIRDPNLPPKEQDRRMVEYYRRVKEIVDKQDRIIQDMIDEGYDMRGA